MASSSVDTVEIERQRQRLDTNLSKLRQSLKHWHAWEAEYEGLKEELDGLGGDATTESLTEISKTYDGALVNEKEIRQLTGLSQGSPHSKRYIKDLISRRQEYVQRNIETLQRQYFVAEGKLEEFAFASAWNHADSEALPLTEIHEELDDEGNVLSSSVSQPEETQAKLVESLRKAGAPTASLSQDEESLKAQSDRQSREQPQLPTPSARLASPLFATKRSKTTGDIPTIRSAISGEQHETCRSPVRKKSVSFTADTKGPPTSLRPESQEKRVSFAPKVAVMPAADLPDTRSVSFSSQIEEIPSQSLGPPSPDARAGAETRVQDTRGRLCATLAPDDKFSEMNDDDSELAQHPVVPEDESEEDARLRREMLEYHLNEVGHVVAQIDLDEAMAETEEADHHSSSEFTSSEYPDDEDTSYTSDSHGDDGSEDEYGRSRHTQIDPEYRDKMLKLQQRLIGNLGPRPSGNEVNATDLDLDPQDVRTLVIQHKPESTTSNEGVESSEQKSPLKKRVSFADGLSIADSERLPPTHKALGTHLDRRETPAADIVTDHDLVSSASASGIPNVDANALHAVSNRATRLKNAQQDTGDIVDDAFSSAYGPPGRTLAEDLVERPAASSGNAPSARDSDAIAERATLTNEYHRLRNRFINEHGGFQEGEDEEEEDELMEERDGKLKKVSRFRAARLKGK